MQQPKLQGTITIAPQGHNYVPAVQNVTINKWHLRVLLDDINRRSQPHGDWCFIPLAMFVTVILTLLTADFRAGYGLDASTWHAVAFLLACITLIATVGLTIWWLSERIRHPPKSSEEIIEALIRQIEADAHAVAAPQSHSLTP